MPGIEYIPGRSDKGGATVYQKHRSLLGLKAVYSGRRLLTASTRTPLTRGIRAGKERG